MSDLRARQSCVDMIPFRTAQFGNFDNKCAFSSIEQPLYTLPVLESFRYMLTFPGNTEKTS